MKAGADDDTPPDGERDEGWDETVLVWNATVAKIPPPLDRATGRRGADPSPDEAPDS